MEITHEARTRMASRLTEKEREIVEERIRVAWERRDTPSLAVVAHEFSEIQHGPDGSNVNIVIGTVKGGQLVTVLLRRDTQVIKANRLEAKSLAWMIPKRPTGRHARKQRRVTNRRY
mgnify:CR=1 FL=1